MTFMTYAHDMNDTKRTPRGKATRPQKDVAVKPIPNFLELTRSSGISTLIGYTTACDPRKDWVYTTPEGRITIVGDRLASPVHAGPSQLPAEIDLILLQRLKSLAPKAIEELQRALASPPKPWEQFRGATESQFKIDLVFLEAASALASNPQYQRINEFHEQLVATQQPSKDPLQAARDRGMNAAVQEWLKPENLTLRDAAAYAGRADRLINEERQMGRVYALVRPGMQRGFRYPMWQFNAEPDRLATALSPFIEAGASCWVVHNFMQRQAEPLENMRPMDWVLDHRKPMDRLVQLVHARYNSEQGAA